jgi:hypothetical protein
MMAAYKFKVGQKVTVVMQARAPKIGGSFTIVRTLPAEQGNNQYRLKSVTDGHERVVMEVQINPV